MLTHPFFSASNYMLNSFDVLLSEYLNENGSDMLDSLISNEKNGYETFELDHFVNLMLSYYNDDKDEFVDNLITCFSDFEDDDLFIEATYNSFLDSKEGLKKLNAISNQNDKDLFVDNYFNNYGYLNNFSIIVLKTRNKLFFVHKSVNDGVVLINNLIFGDLSEIQKIVDSYIENYLFEHANS